MRGITIVSLLLTLIGVAQSASYLEDTGEYCMNIAKSNYEEFDCATSDLRCLCESSQFLQSIMYCIQQEETDVHIKYPRTYVKKACNKVLGRGKVSTSKLQKALTMAKEERSDEEEGRLVARKGGHRYDGLDPKAVKIIKAAKMKRHLADTYAEYFGYSILGFVLLVVILRAVSHLAYKASPVILRFFDFGPFRKIRKYALLPATFGTRHSHPYYVSGYSFNIPTREHTIILTVYVIMNFIYMFTGYQTFEVTPEMEKIVPKEYLDGFKGVAYLRGQIAQRSGILATIQFPLLILFGGRNNFLIWITGWSLDTFNVYHKWFGRIIILLLFIHAVVYSVAEGEFFTQVWAYTYWKWGVVAFICGAIILGQSVHYLRALRYEVFLVGHILLAIFFTVGAWWHLIDMFFYQYVFAAVAVWAFDRFVRVVRIIISGLLSKADVKFFDGDIIEIKISYSGWWKFYPGSYVFIHFLRWNRFWQNHPFTLIESPREEDRGKLVIFAKAKQGITRHTKDYLMKQKDNASRIGVWVEGPYGSNHPVHKYDEVVMFAGGIGITGVYCYAQGIRKSSTRQQKIYLNWVIPDTRPLEWFEEYLEYLREDERFEITIHINKDRDFVEDNPERESIEETTDSDHCDSNSIQEKAESINSGSIVKQFGRPICYQLVEDHIVTSQSNLCFVVCGPGTMNDEIRKSISANLERAPGRVDYFEESFSW